MAEFLAVKTSERIRNIEVNFHGEASDFESLGPIPMMQGIRQGGVLSGKLYLLYINSLLQKLSQSNLGAAVMDLSVCSPTQADDVAFISSRVSALREMNQDASWGVVEEWRRTVKTSVREYHVAQWNRRLADDSGLHKFHRIHRRLEVHPAWTVSLLDASLRQQANFVIKACETVIDLCETRLCHRCVGAVTPQDVKQLKEKIFNGYDVYIRPVHNQTEPVNVDMSFVLYNIAYMDLKIQELKWNGFLSLRWYDRLLLWNASDYGGLDFITVPQTKIWLPDYVVNNAVSQKTRLGTPDTLVHIESSGLVTWEPGMVGETSCKIDIRKYPFDTQTCSFVFSPWMTTSRFLNTTSRFNGIDMSRFLSHGEFATGESSLHFIQIDEVFAEDASVTIRYNLVLHRRPSFYWMVMVFPMASFPLLSPVSFLVPVESGEKITLSITVVLSYLVFIGSINDAMPKLSDTVSLIVIYASIQTLISMLAVVANGIIICVHKLPPDFQITVPMFKTLRRPNASRNTKSDLQYEDSCKSNSPKLELCSFTSKTRALQLEEERMKQKSENNGPHHDKYILLARRFDKICFIFFAFLAIFVSAIFGFLFM
ncbi:acetylcholine receptor subunit alpha-like [Haliotis asinina]|uniref:acetylcholine receptor subunit alpha-like n=1 Tax=Haliotis asinina TaxID=109174 RepID=UPI003532046A